MRPEHVRIEPTERIFAEKNLLHSQLDIISLIRRYESYKSLRAEELLLKIALKAKIAEAKESLDTFDKLLPKPAIVPKMPKAHSEQEHAEQHVAHKRKQTLQEEVEEIRKKLAALQ